MMSGPVVRRFVDQRSFNAAAVELIVGLGRQSIADKGAFHLVLAGGSTPRSVYKTLGEPENAERLDWSKISVFFGDERAVPPDSVHSNYRMALESLLSSVPLPEENIFRIRGERGAHKAAAAYRETIAESGVPLKEGFPVFDLVLLGLGPDGHTASLFPEDPVLDTQELWVAAVAEPNLEPKVARVTLTLPVFNSARKVLFLVSGTEKQDAVERVLFREDVSLPAARVQSVNATWLVCTDP